MSDDKVLLDYYTKSMTIHATIAVAVAFGLFSLLGIISAVPSWLTRTSLTIGFISLVFLGWYEIKRYKHYGSMAKQKSKEFGADEGEEEKGILGFMMNLIFPNAETLFVCLMTYSLIFVWLGFFV